MGRTALIALSLAVVVAASGCGTDQASPRPNGGVAGGTPKPTVAVENDSGLTLKGTRSKSGGPATLEGDYVLAVLVKGKPGCRWSVSLEGLATPVLARYSTNKNGTYRKTVNVGAVEHGDYPLVVKSRKCGTWSVTLKRP